MKEAGARRPQTQAFQLQKVYRNFQKIRRKLHESHHIT